MASGGLSISRTRDAVAGRAFALMLLILPLAAGCASSGDIDALRNSLNNEQLEALNQKKEIAQLKTGMHDISKDMSVLKEQGFGAIKESQSSLVSQTSELSKEVQALRGRFDENKYFIDKTIKDLLSEKDLQQARIAALENELKEMKSKSLKFSDQSEAPRNADKNTPAPQDKATDKKGDTTASSDDPQRFYDDAQIDFKEKRYPDARQKLEQFTRDYPKHQLAPNAYFLLAETYYAEKKKEDAILAYETFLKKYPEHEKVRAAMLKQAYAFADLGDRKTAKVILERIIEKYPQSSEADLAEKKIAEILSKGPIVTPKSKSKPKKR
jgi:tol-pal system protein YbgF